MMRTRVVRAFATGTVAALALLAACEGEQTTENDVFGAPVYDFRLASVGRGLPRTGGQDAVFLTLTSFDTSVADAYARRGDLFTTLRVASLPTLATTGWNLITTLRNGRTDRRAPVPTGASGATLFALQGPEVAGGLWRFSLSPTGLTSGTNYTIALYRFGLTQLDSLDQVAVINKPLLCTMTRPPGIPPCPANQATGIGQPDTLKVLGGTGPSASVAGGCTAATAAASSASANPLILGTFTPTAAAPGLIQRCISDALGLYYPATAVDPTRTPLAPNSGVSFGLGQYNYFVVYNTATTVPVLRAQLGQDLRFGAANDPPINNSFAPMPCDTVAANICPAAAIGRLTTRQKISAPGGEGNVDSLRISIRGLKKLGASGVYQAWLVNPAAGSAPVPALGSLLVTQLDTIADVPVLVTSTDTLVNVTGVSSFVGYPMPQASRVSYRFVVSSTSAGVNLRGYTHVLFTLEPVGPATSPSARTALWFRFGDSKGTADLKDDEYFDGAVTTHPLAALTTGRLDPLSAAAPPYIFAVAGRGFGGFRGDEVSVDFNDLPRPPAGFYYKAWLVNPTAGPNGTDTVYTAVDTLRGPFPERTLLVHADTALVDPVVTDVPPAIGAANIRNFAGNLGLDPNRPCPPDPADPQRDRGLCPFGAYSTYIVTIEPKGSDPASPSPTIVFSASLPTVVKVGK